MLSIQTNVNSLVAQQNLSVNSAFQSKTITQLTSGYRINSSGDDAAGLSVANKFRSMVSELTQGVANGNDAVAQLQIMDGGMNNISKMLDRLKTLAMQSASESFTGNRADLNSEFQNDITEINRQAQSIGLNAGGTFAKSMQIYMGAGSGSQSASNSVVNVDLSKSMVDAQSLGLAGVTVVNSNTYNLGNSSKTSVQNIVGDAANGTSATFTFRGPGFSNSDTTGVEANADNDGVDVTVNITGVSDTTSLVNAINKAIQGVADSSPTGPQYALKQAGIAASIVTDSSGNQKLAFSSGQVAFEVQAKDQMANAFLGNINGSGAAGTTPATGQAEESVSTSTTFNWTTGNAITLTLTNGGITNTAGSANVYTIRTSIATGDRATIVSEMNSWLQTNHKDAGITASLVNNQLRLESKNGDVTVAVGGAQAANLALGNTAATSYSTLVSNGSAQLATNTGTTVEFDYSDANIAASDTQSVTIAANDASGAAHSKTVALTYGATQDLATTVGIINFNLQTSNDPTLQGITAVAKNVNGVDKLAFISNNPGFTVSISAESGSGAGVANTRGIYQLDPADSTKVIVGKTFDSKRIGEGGSADISSVQGAQAAVTAITKAVATLGSAQATIGKSQNQLNYGIDLAQSQITNFSAAESQIRDANVAQQAANLAKAQVLQQASIAAMAQANSAPQAVLSLLRG